MSTSSAVTPQSLRIIRLAILMGVLILGAVGWFVSRDIDPMDASVLSTLRLVFLAICIGALGGVLALRRLWQNADTFQRKATLTIMATAAGEVPALFGGVYLILSGDYTLYLGGLLILLVPILLMPTPSQATA
ncbi:MAG: hypothetical protein AAGI71_09450 [Bacteroidota bacterium]